MEWWSDPMMSNCNIGIPTGPENDLSVLDVDVHNDQPGMEEFGKLKDRILEKSGVAFPDDSPTVITGSGGLQIYFKYHNDVNNSSAQIAPGLDTRGKGGYIVAPPSFNVGGQYKWDKWLKQIPIKSCPQIIADELIAKKAAPKKPKNLLLHLMVPLLLFLATHQHLQMSRFYRECHKAREMRQFSN